MGGGAIWPYRERFSSGLCVGFICRLEGLSGKDYGVMRWLLDLGSIACFVAACL